MNSRAIVLMAFSLLYAALAHADLLSVNVSVDEIQGVGVFNTDGLCLICTPDSGLSDFTFSLGGDSFTVDEVTFFRASNSLHASLTGTDDVLSHLLFTPSGNVQFSQREHGHQVVLHGDYALGRDPLNTPPAAEATATVPESASVALLLTAVGMIAIFSWRTELHG